MMDSSQVLYILLFLASSLLSLLVGIVLRSLSKNMFRGSNSAILSEDIAHFHNRIKWVKGMKEIGQADLLWTEQPEYKKFYDISRTCFFFFWLFLAVSIILYGQGVYDLGIAFAVCLLGFLEFYYIIGMLKSYSSALKAFQSPRGARRKVYLNAYKERWRQTDDQKGKEKDRQQKMLKNEQPLYCFYDELVGKYAVKSAFVFVPLFIGLTYVI